MPSNTPHQIVNISGKGKLNAVDDQYVGGPVNQLTGLPFYRGQLGAKLAVDHEHAADLSDTSVATLYGGIYRYVQTKAGSTAAPARGLVAFYATAADVQADVVTPDAPANDGCIAGIYISAPTKGQYCWIQVSGLAGVKFRASITRATPAAQCMVYVQSGTNVADQIEDNTNITESVLRRVLGVAAETPVGAAIKLVELWERFVNY